MFEGGREFQRLLLCGRAGSIGNTGAPGLVGGQGFLGKTSIVVRVDIDGPTDP